MPWLASSQPLQVPTAVAATKPPRRPRKPVTVLQRAVRLLARRDMSRAELLARLATARSAESSAVPADKAPESPDVVSSGAPTDPAGDIEAALVRLQALGLQSDSRFAENYVRGRQARTGSRRLVAELRHKGVDAETIDAALAELAGSDLQRARALWAGRFEFTRDPRERARQMRFLAGRGFDPGVIRTVVGGTPEDDTSVVDDLPQQPAED